MIIFGLAMLFFILLKQDTSGLVDSAVSYGEMRPGFKTRWRRIVSEMRELDWQLVGSWWVVTLGIVKVRKGKDSQTLLPFLFIENTRAITEKWRLQTFCFII